MVSAAVRLKDIEPNNMPNRSYVSSTFGARDVEAAVWTAIV